MFEPPFERAPGPAPNARSWVIQLSCRQHPESQWPSLFFGSPMPAGSALPKAGEFYLGLGFAGFAVGDGLCVEVGEAVGEGVGVGLGARSSDRVFSSCATLNLGTRKIRPSSFFPSFSFFSAASCLVLKSLSSLSFSYGFSFGPGVRVFGTSPETLIVTG